MLFLCVMCITIKYFNIGIHIKNNSMKLENSIVRQGVRLVSHRRLNISLSKCNIS